MTRKEIIFFTKARSIIIENITMSKSDAQKLLDLSAQFAKLQARMDDILKKGSLNPEPRQAISPQEILDQRFTCRSRT